MYTYIVIDDESLIRKGTIKKLQPMEDRITCIGEADNGKAGIELIQEVHPDIRDSGYADANHGWERTASLSGRKLSRYATDRHQRLP